MDIKGERLGEWWGMPAKPEPRRLSMRALLGMTLSQKQIHHPTKIQETAPNDQPTTKLEGALHVFQIANLLLTLRGISCLWEYQLVQPLEKTSNAY